MGQICGCGSNPNPIPPKKKSLKVLVLGAGESGKTTLIRQFELLQDKSTHGFSARRKSQARSSVLSNLVEGAYRLLEHGRYTDDRMVDEKSIAAYREVVAFYRAHSDPDSSPDEIGVNYQSVQELTEEVAHALVQLAGDQKFLNTLRDASKLQIPDGWSYFIERIKEYPTWGGPEWIPDDEDVLHVRIRTLGISPNKFEFQGRKYEVFDVGGQMVERKKWVKQFFNVQVLIWMQSLSDYDELMWENDSENRFLDSLKTFEETVNIKQKSGNPPEEYFVFEDSAIIIFLNKEDLCHKKFCDWRIPIGPELGTDEFPVPVYNESLSAEENLQAVKAWYAGRLESKFRIPDKLVNVHTLTALQQQTVKVLIDAVLTENFLRVFEGVGLIR